MTANMTTQGAAVLKCDACHTETFTIGVKSGAETRRAAAVHGWQVATLDRKQDFGPECFGDW